MPDCILGGKKILGQSSIDEGNHPVLVKCQFTDKGEGRYLNFKIKSIQFAGLDGKLPWEKFFGEIRMKIIPKCQGRTKKFQNPFVGLDPTFSPGSLDKSVEEIYAGTRWRNQNNYSKL
ncbi:hypothetical protein PABG_12067 [Paracoccidioides brasiliensis Pb03]|nr:hypothetical protein PABG_12067 [Paracoccidioides brasiliensis Pb03]